MKKVIFISIAALLCSFHLFATDPYKVRTEVFELEVTKVMDIVPYQILTASDFSLELTATSNDIIDYLYPGELESEIKLNQMYRIEVNSTQEIEKIKKDILYFFCKAAGLQLKMQAKKQTNYILSYPTSLDSCEVKLQESRNTSPQLILDLKNRVVLKGMSLPNLVEQLNEALEVNKFEAGTSAFRSLPGMNFLKRKLRNDPVAYLQTKGFVVEPVERVIETPLLVYAE